MSKSESINAVISTLGILLFLQMVEPVTSADAPTQRALIQVHADQVVGRVSRYLTGACIEDVNHEIYGGLYSQMIFGESFQEPVPSPTIQGFKTYGGQWVTRGDTLSINGLDGPKLVSDQNASKDGTVGVELFFADRKGGNAGLIVRVSQASMGADQFIGYEVSLDTERQILRLGRHRHNFELIKDVPCEVAIGRWLSLEVRLAGSLIDILVDNKKVLHHDDGPNALPAGTIGLRAWHREVSYRHLWVKSGEQIEPLTFTKTEETPEISSMWRAVKRGSAKGRYALISQQPFAGVQSQQVTFESGDGEWGIENQSLNRWGMNFVGGKTYEGCVWARAEKPVSMFVALESRDGYHVYTEKPMAITSNQWQRLDFTLTPQTDDTRGRFVIKLKQPATVELGYAFLQPAEWGRFKGLPVRRDVAEGLVSQGITVLRYGGSMVNHPNYKWKKMIGSRDRRPPYAGTWYAYSSNGWGIPDFMDFCEAAGFEYIPAFNLDESPQDMADFIEYAKGANSSEWGRRRVADGHASPYRLRYIELGNEERVDEQYAAKFEALAEAIWAKDPNLILVVGDFIYGKRIQDPFHFDGAASRITSLAGHQRILRFAKRYQGEVWFDVHVGTESPVAFNDELDGAFSLVDALAQLAEGARHKVVIFEFNAGNHAHKRALANALAINAIERDGRIPIATSANGLQPDGQNDNGWDQGLLFLNPSQVWLQSPGYVTQMLSHNYLPNRIHCEVTDATGKLDANAKRSADGKTLILQVVNPGNEAIKTQVQLIGFIPHNPVIQTTELSGSLDRVNTAAQKEVIIPKQNQRKCDFKEGIVSYTFPPHSFTLIKFE